MTTTHCFACGQELPPAPDVKTLFGVKEPVDPRIEPLWQVINCWYPDVALAIEHCAQVMKVTNAPLSDDAQFIVAANLHGLQADGTISIEPMDATWMHSVEIAHDALLYLYGDRTDPGGAMEEWVEKFGPVGTYAETADLVYRACHRMY